MAGPAVASIHRDRPLLDLLFIHRRDPLDHLLRCLRADRGVSVFRLGPRRLVALAEPDLIQDVLARGARDFLKAHPFEAGLPWARAILGRGLLVSEGQDWLRQRRMMQPAFHRERIASDVPAMAEIVEREIEGWPPGIARDVYADLSRLTLETLATAVFGARRHAAELHDGLRGVFDHRPITGGLFRLVPEWVPTPANVRTRSALRRLDRAVYAVIAERRISPERPRDLLTMIIEARDETGAASTDQQVRDEIMSTIVAGHDTLAATLAFGFDVLARQQDVQDLLASELERTLSAKTSSADDLRGSVYLDRIARETLRLFPAGKNSVRVAAVACEVGNVRIAPGDVVILSQWVAHRDPRWYEDPEAFRPERWADGLAERLPRGAFFPFGLGPRMCLGASFAEQMVRLVLALVIRRFRLEPHPDPTRTEWDRATLRPRRGLWLVPRRR